jgi:hypothetical protein
MNIMRSKATAVQNMINHDGIDFGNRPVSGAINLVSIIGGDKCYLQALRNLK